MEPFINTMLDPIVNFGKVTVSTGYTNLDTIIVLNSGEGSKLPDPSTDGSFNLVWFNSSIYGNATDDPNVEIVRCIARVGDTLTVMRGQEGTTASNKNIPTNTYNMILSLTKKTITDIKTEYESGVSTHSALSTGIHGVGVSTVESTSGSQAKIDTHSALSTSVHNFDSLGDAPAQTHGISRHTGTIGDHTTNLSNVGTNTHAQIDTAVTNSTNHIAAIGTSVHGLGTMSTQNANAVSITAGTITGTRINPRASTIASSATPTPAGDTTDHFTVTALATAATFGAPTGTPVDGQKLIIRIKDNGTARALAWNAIYRAGTDVPLPTTTVINKTMYIGFIYNSADAKWDCVASMGTL